MNRLINDYIGIYRDGLLDDILPFWLNHSIDKEYGGYIFSLNRDGTILDTDKGIWQTGRFIWMLSTMYNDVEKREDWLQAALHGADFLEKFGFDTDKRMFFQVNREGLPLRKRRYVFSESFAAIAFASLYKATGKEKYAIKAKECFDIYYNFSTTPGKIEPKYTENRQMKGLGGPMIGIVTAQELRKNLSDNSYTKFIDEWINEIESDFMKPDLGLVMESVGKKGEILDHFDGRTLTPGHSIEAAWFILNEAKYRGGDKRLVDIGCTIIDWMWERGWDKEYGGMLYFIDMKGLPVQEYWHDMKFWWPQNEAAIATLMAYQATGEEKHLKRHEQVMVYTEENFIDSEFGEWYGYLHRDGRLSTDLKGNIYKGPFHIPRMYYRLWKTLADAGY